MRKFIIWLFRLKHIQALLQKEREKQKAQDEKYYRRKLADMQESHAMELDYQAQSYEAQLTMLKAELQAGRKREKALTQLEYRLKKQVKRNISIATIAHGHIANVAEMLNKEAYEIHGLLDRIQDEQKKIGE